MPDVDGVSFTVTRELDAPPEAVWAAWTDPRLVRSWWGPRGFTCPRAELDVRVRGTSLVTMQAPPEYGGFRMHNRWTYTVVESPTRLEFTSTFADENGTVIAPAEAGIPPGVPDEVPHVVALEPLPGGGTRLTVVERGYASEEAAALSRSGQEECLDKMAALLAEGTDLPAAR